MSLPLCFMNFFVAGAWTYYGYLLWDLFIIVPNAIGTLLGAVQLALIFVYPPVPPVAPIEENVPQRRGPVLEYKV